VHACALGEVELGPEGVQSQCNFLALFFRWFVFFRMGEAELGAGGTKGGRTTPGGSGEGNSMRVFGFRAMQRLHG
jgi:hypothetical protein